MSQGNEKQLAVRAVKELTVPDDSLLSLVRPQQRAWATLPSMAAALTAFQGNRRSIVVQVNGLALAAGHITPSGTWRCMRVAEALATSELPWDATIIATGADTMNAGKSEAEAFRTEIIKHLERYGEVYPSRDILLEETASNTFENAENCAHIVRELVTKYEKDPTTGKAPPYLLIIATTDWHYERQELTNSIVPEASEFFLWRREFPEIDVRPLKAAYPPWFSRQPQTRWLARSHVATHFFAPLMANICGIRDGKLKSPELRQESVAVFGAALVEFSVLEEDIPFDGARKRQLEETYEQLKGDWADLCDFYALVKDRMGILPLDTDQGEWSAYAKRLSDLTGDIRYVSDPDRR